MKKAPANSVIFDSDVLKFIISTTLKNYPNEAGFFLRGQKQPRAGRTYNIEGYYYPPSDSTPYQWSWDKKEWAEATRWAVGKEARIIGMAHSHCYNKLSYEGFKPSRADVDLQHEFNFDVSLILTIWGKHNWYMTSWVKDAPLSLNQYIRYGGSILSMYRWLNTIDASFVSDYRPTE